MIKENGYIADDWQDPYLMKSLFESRMDGQVSTGNPDAEINITEMPVGMEIDITPQRIKG